MKKLTELLNNKEYAEAFAYCVDNKDKLDDILRCLIERIEEREPVLYTSTPRYGKSWFWDIWAQEYKTEPVKGEKVFYNDDCAYLIPRGNLLT
jgi:hypothetical protein